MLAHEFTHHVHSEVNPWPGRHPESLDQRFAVAAYREGMAMYVHRWYFEEHAVGTLGSMELSDSTPEARWSTARYTLGYRYLAARADEVPDANALLKLRWPNTSEQILHPERGYEPAKPLSVRPGSPNKNGRTDYVPLRTPRKNGELAVRIAIWSRTNASAASRAASGWGNDRLLGFQGPEGDGYAWVIRYDDESAARTGRALFETYHDAERRSFESAESVNDAISTRQRVATAFWRARGNRSFDTELVENETLVVFAGPEAFVANASASGTAANVTVGTVNDGENASSVVQSSKAPHASRVGIQRPPGNWWKAPVWASSSRSSNAASTLDLSSSVRSQRSA